MAVPDALAQLPFFEAGATAPLDSATYNPDPDAPSTSGS